MQEESAEQNRGFAHPFGSLTPPSRINSGATGLTMQDGRSRQVNALRMAVGSTASAMTTSFGAFVDGRHYEATPSVVPSVATNLLKQSRQKADRPVTPSPPVPLSPASSLRSRFRRGGRKAGAQSRPEAPGSDFIPHPPPSERHRSRAGASSAGAISAASDLKPFAADGFIRQEFGGRPLEDDAAVSHHVDAVRDAHGDHQPLLDQEDRDPAWEVGGPRDGREFAGVTSPYD